MSSTLLSGIAAENRNPAIDVHQALITLAQRLSGTDSAYQVLRDPASAQAVAARAVASRDPGQLRACALIELLAHQRPFAGTLHLVLAWLMGESAGQLPDGWLRELQALAASASPTEKDTALVQFAETPRLACLRPVNDLDDDDFTACCAVRDCPPARVLEPDAVARGAEQWYFTWLQHPVRISVSDEIVSAACGHNYPP
jgi:hypothetical protein